MPKPMRQKAPKGAETNVDDNICDCLLFHNDSMFLANILPADPRFANIQTDPRFRLPSKKSTHVQIDKRFAHMLRDDDFSSRAKVDRYGRKLSKNSGKDELKRYYRIEDQDEGSSEDEDDEVERELERVNAELSTSEDSLSDNEDLDEAEEDEVFGLLDDQEGGDGIPKGEVSSRIAVVNLDWDNIRAADLMVVFSSFVPSTAGIRKISVYPSHFGKERMDKEEMDGPPKEIFGGKKISVPENDQSESSEEGDKEDEEGDEAEDDRIRKSILKEDQGQEFNSAKLRRYQLERLRYYYAVLECSSVSVAQSIYEAVDGTEYLTTANFFDLRYIPHEMDFSEDEPRDECERIPDGYKPSEFVTDALQHSKVRLTWDADDVSRKEAQKRAFSGSRADIDENDLKAYLGTDSSEDEGPAPLIVDATSVAPSPASNGRQRGEKSGPISKKEVERERMRALLGLQSEPTSKKSRAVNIAPVGDMQVTFSSGLISEATKGSVFENEPERDETTAEKYIRKEKERKGRRKEKMKASRRGTDPYVEVASAKVQPNDISDIGDGKEQDLGFADPFFTASTNDKATSNAQRKADKRQKTEERAAEEATAASERAELELLMVDDKTDTKDINHFDINEIIKAEKALSKRKKTKRKMTEREKQAFQAKDKDHFTINVGDERFRDVFESNEFAIDPSHPRFKGTEGMKRLLDEGRRKRRLGDGDDAAHEEDFTQKAKKRKLENAPDVGDVKRLVDSVKRQTKKGRIERAQA